MASRVIRAQLLRELLVNDDPFHHANSSLVDGGYPHTHLAPKLIPAVLKAHEEQHGEPVSFWLECGSMLGGSIIRVARATSHMPGFSLVAMDPWTGDVNMWAMEAKLAERAGSRRTFRFLHMRAGQPTIWDRFIANVAKAGVADTVLPLRVTASVGLKLLPRLRKEQRLAHLPQVIYLDSAHDQGETFNELQLAWAALPRGGLLFGDDWGWDGVHHDVLLFAQCLGPAGAQAQAHGSAIGRLLGEPTLSRPCIAVRDNAGLLKRQGVYWQRNHSDTARWCVDGAHEVLLYGRGHWMLVKGRDDRRVLGAPCSLLS